MLEHTAAPMQFCSTHLIRLARRLASSPLSWVPFAMGLGACGSQPADPPKNLVFVLFDTTRADRMGFGGYERDSTPRLDDFAAKSVVFERHRSHASRTGPSVATLFTGLHQRSHGVVNELELVNSKGVLDAQHQTLAEQLKAQGYECHGLVTNLNITARFGFNQGFDSYEEPHPGAPPSIHRDALALLDRMQEPFFLYIHVMAPHTPYFSYPPHTEAFVDPAYDGELTGTNQELNFIVKHPEVLEEDDRRHLSDLHDQCLLWADEYAGELFDELERRGLSERSVSVFTSDHGEEFFDHGSVLHGYTLYEEQLHVPLVIRAPGFDPRRIPGSTHHVDVMPTLLQLLDVPAPAGLQGRSLVGSMRGDAPADADVHFAQASLRAMKTVKLDSFEQDGWKLIVNQLPEERLELYNLAQDPDERENLATKQPEQLKRLLAAMAEFEAGLSEHQSTSVELSESEQAELRDLGYAR